MSDVVRHVVARGRVQGVGYRAFVEHVALLRRLEGWVRNRRDSTVEVVFSGEEAEVREAIAACRRGPAAAQVEAVEVTDGESALLTHRRPGERFSVLATA